MSLLHDPDTTADTHDSRSALAPEDHPPCRPHQQRDPADYHKTRKLPGCAVPPTQDRGAPRIPLQRQPLPNPC
jgi:hypothetical protein